VVALIEPENERSIAVAERLGLAHERDVLQKGATRVRLYALDAGRVPLRR
jgi:RimJ/RimL family protein N-acetyltransferase